MRALGLLLAVLVAGGCYRYVAAPASGVEPGMKVRAVLSDHGTADLARYLGPSVTAVEGQVISSSEIEMIVAVSLTELHSGMENYWNNEQVALPRNALASVYLQRFSGARTALLAGGITAGGLLLNAALGNALSIGGGGKGDGDSSKQ